MRRIASILLKVGFLMCCMALAFDGRHPPAMAQTSTYDAIRADAHRDDAIDSQRKDLDDLNRKVQKQWDTISANTNAISGMQGENRVMFAVLGLLISGSITLQIRSKKA